MAQYTADVLSFFELMARKMAAEADMAEKWVQDRHWPSVGISREATLRRFIASYLPQQWRCDTGFVVGVNGRELSRQCDVIIHDRASYAPLYVEDDFVVVRHDAVVAVVEVKSRVNEMVFGEALDNIRAAKSLNDSIRGLVFALSGPERFETVEDWLRHASEQGVPPPTTRKVKDDATGEETEVTTKGTPLPAEHLPDFVHFANGMQVWRPVVAGLPPDLDHTNPASLGEAHPAHHDTRSERTGNQSEQAAVELYVRKFTESNSGEALAFFWDQLLSYCTSGAQLGILEYLGRKLPSAEETIAYKATAKGG